MTVHSASNTEVAASYTFSNVDASQTWTDKDLEYILTGWCRDEKIAAHIHSLYLLLCAQNLWTAPQLHHAMIHSKSVGFMFIPGQLSVGKL